MRAAAATLLALAVLGTSCQSTEPEDLPDHPAGPPLDVRLVGGGFVQFEGRRITLEDFLYDLRLRCRDAGDQAMPWLRVTAPREEVPGIPAAVDRIRREAWGIGVQHVEFELGDS